MAALPKSKFSGSNIVLLIVCLMVIIAVLLLNIFNAKNLAQLRSYLNSLSSDNSKVDVLRNTNKELLEAENSYRLYLSTKDTLYSNKYLSHLVSCVNDLTAIKSSNDTVGVSAIIAGIEQKIQVSDAIDLLKRISDSISISKISANNGGFYINPYWYRMSNNSILKGYDSLMQQTDTSQSTGNKKKAFINKLKDAFGNKEEADKAIASSNTASTPSATGHIITGQPDQSQMDVDAFYQTKYNELTLKEKLDANEKQLAQINLRIEYQLNDALKKISGLEEEAGKEKEDLVVERAKQAKDTINLLSWASYLIIICVVIALVYNVRKSMLYEKEIIEARETAERLVMTKSRFLSNMSHEIRTIQIRNAI